MNSIIRHLEYQQCRTCYNSTNNLQLLTSFADSSLGQADAKTYVQLLLEVCNINILEDKPIEQWPQFICFNCCKKLKFAHDFIQQTRKINQVLKSIADLMKTKIGEDFIEKPELDIPLEMKMEKDDDVEVVPNERVFQYSPIESEVLRDQSHLLYCDKSDNIPCNNYTFKEDAIYEIIENDNQNFIEIMIPSAIEFINNDIVVKDDLKKFDSEDVNNVNNDKSNNSTTCSKCNKKFSSAWNLKRHQFTHTAKENKISCPRCVHKFTYPDSLKRHLQNVHKLKNLQSKKINIKSSHKTVSKACKDMASFTCNECKKIYSSFTKLSRHKRFAHKREEEKIDCNFCGKKFGRTGNLKRHLELAHGVENISPQKHLVKIKGSRFLCDKCDRSYTIRSNLFRHNREFHGKM